MPDTTLTRKDLTYAESVNRALRLVLDNDPTTLLFGEDVGVPGGVFGVTKGLRKRFGDRVFDTPISEAAILGGAVGAAMVGRRPIVEIMWADFALVALDQIVNQAANVRYINRGELSAPMTIRTQQSTAPGACAQHSQSLEALFAHIPGLHVCMPTTHQDAHDLLLAAIADDDPTIVIENRTLYHGAKESVTLGNPIQSVGGAAIRRTGTDLTVATWGAMQHRVLDAAERLETDHGISVEVIDMRWLRPLDIDAVVDSVERTGGLAVAHEAMEFAGLGAELVASVLERGVELRRPPVRIASPAARIPAAPTLLQAVVPDAEAIAARIRAHVTEAVQVS
ncbi:pyruvate/2-oxoglutarate/acetoin dehydrogenase E1 component [Prauserella sediminis]|uniref:Pyruvate/2-oxoglutarate/acetoin dehydrogenase E1 component n=1 Tax=Prauserella sediminis TaxID=577680 RepID=A0A839XP35_9PSEU|nr:transketolase C-terminal domain-containing protein [Prauserella sediminis]MBB3664511.1 pyruvate/2-oxoglutarate/acetoin dehydrogenase E1 component [Prauserella sediminis]